MLCVNVRVRFFDFATFSDAIIDCNKIVHREDLAYTFLQHFYCQLKEDQLDENVLLQMIRINICTVVNPDKCMLGQDDNIIDVTISMDELE